MAFTPEERRERQLAAVRKYRREKYTQFRKLADLRAKEWRKKNPEKLNAGQRARHRRNPRIMMLARAKYRAKITGILFAITADDIRIPEFCPLLGIPLSVSDGAHSAGSPSIDRIRNELGYVPGNVWVISHRANAVKSNFTLEELEQLTAALRQRMLATN